MIPDCGKCGEPMRLMWCLTGMRDGKWVTRERYYCEACRHMQDAEFPGTLWDLWPQEVRDAMLATIKVPSGRKPPWARNNTKQ